MNEYSIHKLKPEDFELLLPLMQDSFGMEVNVKYFEWKFKNNPAGFVEGYIAKDSNGEVGAYYGVIPEFYVIKGERRTIFQSCDTMTHSNHRRKGLFKKLALYCYENLRVEDKMFVIGFGGGQSTPGFIKFGWKEVFKMRNYFYPKQFNAFNNCKYTGVVQIDNYKEIEHLIESSNAHSVIHSFKNAAIFQWRVSNPLNNYKTIATMDQNKIFDSYLTYYEKDDKIVLFDYHIAWYHSGKQLFNYIKSLLNAKHKGIISFVQENSSYSKTILKYSFITNPFNKGPLNLKTPFIFYAPDKELEEFNDKTKWGINSFDHDAI